MFSDQRDLKWERGLPKTLFFPARQWEKAQRTLYHEPKVPFLVWVLPVADQNHSFISLKFSASSSTRKNNLDWENKWSKGAEARQVFHFFLATGTQHTKGAWSCASPVSPERWHSPTLEANFRQPLCSISISWQLTINRCDRKASLYACTISAILGSNTGSLCQSHGHWMLSNCYFCWRPLPLGLWTNQHHHMINVKVQHAIRSYTFPPSVTELDLYRRCKRKQSP